MDSEGIRERIVLAVSKKEITLKKLIEDCDLNEQSFYRYMNGGREWTVDYLITIANYYDMDLDYLIRGHRPDDKGPPTKDIEKLAQLEAENRRLREELGKVRTFIGGAIKLLPQAEALKKGMRRKK